MAPSYDIICSPTLSDAAIITGASTSGDLTLANLQEMQPAKVARFLSLSDMHVVVDLGEAHPITYAWLRSPNASNEGTIRWRFADTEANLTASPGYDTDNIPFIGIGLLPGEPLPNFTYWPFRDHHLNLLDTPKDYRYVRFDILDPDNANTFSAGIDLSRLYISVAIRTPHGMTIQDIGPMQPSVVIQSQGGSEFPVATPNRNSLTVAVKGLTRADALGDMFELSRTRGVSKDILIVRAANDPTYIHEETIYGRVAESYRLTSENKIHYETVIKVIDLSDLIDE